MLFLRGYCRLCLFLLGPWTGEESRTRTYITLSFPSLFSLGNLALGLAAIYLANTGRYEYVTGVLFLAFIFDTLDGIVARIFALHKTELAKLGIFIDSSADLASWAIAPALIIRRACSDHGLAELGMVLSVVYFLAAATRLARFSLSNNSIRYHHQGLPSPYAALLAVSWAVVPPNLVQLGPSWGFYWAIVMVVIVCAAALLMNLFRVLYRWHPFLLGKRFAHTTGLMAVLSFTKIAQYMFLGYVGVYVLLAASCGHGILRCSTWLQGLQESIAEFGQLADEINVAMGRAHRVL